MRPSPSILLPLSLLWLAPLRPAAAQTYTVTDLGMANGRCLEPHSINNRGQITGSFTSASGQQSAFLYSDGVTDLGSSGPHYGSSRGSSININGQVTGNRRLPMLLADKVEVYHAVIYSGGTMKDIGTLPGDIHSFGIGINDSGDVVGFASSDKSDTLYYEDLNYHSRAFLFRNGRMIALGALGGRFSTATAINNKGDITGSAQTAHHGSSRHAFLYRGGRTMDLGSLPHYDDSAATSINSKDQITGDAQVAQGRHAFLYNGGRLHDLGSLPGYAESYGYTINDVGQIVGEAVSADYKSRAFLFSGGRMRDLNSLIPPDSNWLLKSASGINNKGQIVGMGEHKGQRRGFLLMPKQ